LAFKFDWKLFGSGPTYQRLPLPPGPACRRTLGMSMPRSDPLNGAVRLYRRGRFNRAGLTLPPCLHGRRRRVTPSLWSSPVSSPHCRYGRYVPPPLTTQFSRAQVSAERHRTGRLVYGEPHRRCLYGGVHPHSPLFSSVLRRSESRSPSEPS
jgi:hypothetical protein